MEVIPACIFAYSGDSLPVKECVRGAILAGLLPVVCDDSHNPLPRTTVAMLRNMGALYQQTFFIRNGNLNGTHCAAGIAATMYQVCDDVGARIAIKLDADTIVLRKEVFTETSTGIHSSLHHRREAFGCVYSLTKRTAKVVADYLESQPNDPTAPEDITIWRAMKTKKREHIMHDFRRDGGAFSAVPTHFDPLQCFRFAACTFGNPPVTGWTDRPLQIHNAMKRLNDYNLRLAQSEK